MWSDGPLHKNKLKLCDTDEAIQMKEGFIESAERQISTQMSWRGFVLRMMGDPGSELRELTQMESLKPYQHS